MYWKNNAQGITSCLIAFLNDMCNSNKYQKQDRKSVTCFFQFVRTKDTEINNSHRKMLSVNFINWVYYLLYLRNELVYLLRQKLYLHRKLNKKMQSFYFLKYVHFFGKAPILIPAKGLSIQCSFKHKIHLVSSGMDKSILQYSFQYWLCTPTLILWLYILLCMERD